MFNDDFSKNVSQTADAYRGNPAKLQKEYKINNDLAKLIAYQQLTTEANDLANAAKLREAQQPNSIKQQYEDKLVQEKTNSLMNRVDQVAGIPQNLQRPRPQGQNQRPQGIAAAQRPPMAQGQRPPMAQGQRPPMAQGQRPPMPSMGMAQGGIASYNYGGPVQKFQAGSNDPVEVDALTDAMNRYSSSQNNGASNVDLTTTTTTSTDADFGKIIKDITGKNLRDLGNLPERTMSTNAITEALSKNEPELMKRLREQANLDPYQARTDKAAELTSRYMPEEEENNPLAVLKRQIEEQKKQKTDIRDPDRVRREDNQTYISAMALGGPRGYSRAMNKLRENRSEGEKEAMANVSKLQLARTSKRQELLEKVDAGAAAEFKDVYAAHKSAADSIAKMSSEGIKLEQDHFKMMLERSSATLRSAIAAANGIVASQMKVIQQESLSLEKLKGAYQVVSDAKFKVMTNLIESQKMDRMSIKVAKDNYNKNKTSPTAIEAYNTAIERQEELDKFVAEQTQGMKTFIEAYTQKMLEIGANG